jgi:hypothetical protein
MKLYVVCFVVVAALIGAAVAFSNSTPTPEQDVARLVYLDYEVGVDECWKDISGFKSFICKVNYNHPQLGNLWCFTVEKWDGKRPADVLLSHSGYDCDFEAVRNAPQSSY